MVDITVIAKDIIDNEVFYWGDKGLETTQRCAQKAGLVREFLLKYIGECETAESWIKVTKEIYDLR